MSNALACCAAVLAVAFTLVTACRTYRSPNEEWQKRGEHERIVLEGCVAAAPGNNRYVLRKVFVPDPAVQPQGNENFAADLQVPPGSWVLLTPGPVNLRQYLGKRVLVQGVVEDTGDNTLRTSASIGDLREKFARSARDAATNPERAVPPSTVAPAGADANGLAPRIAVEKIKKLADSCEGPTGR